MGWASALCVVVAGCSSAPPPAPSGPDPATCLLSDQTAMTCTKDSDCCTNSCADDGLGDGRKFCQCTSSGGTCGTTNDCCQLDNTCVGYDSTTLGTCQ